MRPQRFSCGVRAGVARLAHAGRSFNEAAAFQLGSQIGQAVKLDSTVLQ